MDHTQTFPGLFTFLWQEACISHTDIFSTADDFFAITKPLSRILAEKGIFHVPDSQGTPLACDRFFDDWHLYAIPGKQAAVYGLFKLREQEQDALQGIYADGDTPGVTISFIALREDILRACLTNPTEENRKLLFDEIDRVVARSGQRHHPAMKQYFKDPTSHGAYLVAELYVKKIAALAQDGRLDTPTACWKKGTRLFETLAKLNRSAGCVVCDGDNIYIADKKHPTQWEAAVILATHTGCASVYAFAAEVEYHAKFLTPLAKLKLPFLGRSPYASAIRADLSIADTEFEGPAPYHREASRIVRRQRRLHPTPSTKKQTPV